VSVRQLPISHEHLRNDAQVGESVLDLTSGRPGPYLTILAPPHVDAAVDLDLEFAVDLDLDLDLAVDLDLDLDLDLDVVPDLAVVPDLDVDGAADASRPTISLLGTFSFRCGDRPISLAGGSRKLLALLALRGRPMTRAYVAYTLWPDASESDASSCLRSALCRLKNKAGDLIDVANLDLELRPNVCVDLRESRALAIRLLDAPATALRGESATSAVQRLSGDVLPGWSDDWAAAETIEWHQLRLHALEAMAAHLAETGRYADATVAAMAAVRAEPLRESAHCALVETFLAEGNQKEALDGFDRFRGLLRAELGVDPSPRISGLVGGLRRRSTDN